MSKNQGGKVVSLVTKCIADDCKRKPEVAGFCSEHFVWFKEGLITKEGHKPSDFDKKFIAFMRRNKKSA